MKKNYLKPILEYYVANKQKTICFLFIGLFALLSLFAIIKSSFKPKDKPFQQLQIHPDEFFNTTPRIRNKEKIIIVYKDGNIIKNTEILDNRGQVQNSKEEIIGESNGVLRDNEVLRTGEKLRDGDIVDERIMSNGMGFYKEQDIIQNNEIKTTNEPLDKNGNVIHINENDIKDGVEVNSIIEVINGRQYIIKEFITKDGKRFKRTFDSNSNLVPEDTILSDEIVGNEDGDSLIRIIKQIKNGEIITINKKARDTENGDEFGLNPEGLFKFKQNTQIGLTEQDEINISKLKHERNTRNKGSIKFVENEEQIDFQILNRDKDFSSHNEPKTTPTYPVDLTRVLTMDRIIPAVLITAIKSDIPSKKVLAQTEQDVYGTHGRKILIPKGSKVIGSYERLDDRAIERIAIAWYRIITPEGVNIRLEGELNDLMGVAGITGDIDRRIADRYGNAFLLSTLNAMAQLSVPINNPQAKAGADAFTKEFSAITGQLIRESLKVMPTITIPQGTRVNISPLQDVWFREVEGNEAKVAFNHKI